MKLYQIAKSPNIRATQNKETWQKLESRLGKGSATKEQLVTYCKDHDHPAGGSGFIEYCIQNGWLVELDGVSSRKAKQKTNKIVSEITPNASGTGVYLAYPTSEKLKPIYRGYKTKVNSCHTKVGITTDSFASRATDYAKTFDGEIVFEPLAEIPSELLTELEDYIINKLSLHFDIVGTTKEWFDTDNHDLVKEVVLKAISEYIS